MSPSDTKRLGDLQELPACAPAGLKALFTLAEGIIQAQAELLGSGTPSMAPDLRQLLVDQGIDAPEDESTMIDQYSDHKDEMSEVMSGLARKDDGVLVRTAGIGAVVTDAYVAIDASVVLLNEQIAAAHNAVRIITDENDEPVLDENGNVKKELPTDIINGLFTGVWDTLDITFNQVKGVSDQAATEATNINADKPSYDSAPSDNYGSTPPASYAGNPASASYPGTGYGGDTSHSPDSGSMGTATIPSGEKPKALEMMRYLIEKHGFTPAQAAGIVANARYESNFDVGAVGDNGTASGLFQWRFDRQENLIEFASQEGRSLGDWRTHVDFMVKELRVGDDYQRAESRINSENYRNDPRAVAQAFDEDYEKSSGHTIPMRREYAAGLLREWNNSSPSAASSPSVAV